MPLLRTPGEPELDAERSMLGFWMRDPAVPIGPVEGVRVFITLEALWTLEPSRPRDVATAFEIFGRHRGKVELAASRRFDDASGGPVPDELFDGRPVIVITGYELSQLPVEWDYSTGRRK